MVVLEGYLRVVNSLKGRQWTEARAALDALNERPAVSHPRIDSAVYYGAPEDYAPVLQDRINFANDRRLKRA